MIIELLDGENEIRLAGTGASEDSGTEATDGIYVSLARYAEENDISEGMVRVWKNRGKLKTVVILGRVYVKKDSLPSTRRYKNPINRYKRCSK